MSPHNQSTRLRVLLLAMASGGVFFLFMLFLAVRSCTSRPEHAREGADEPAVVPTSIGSTPVTAPAGPGAAQPQPASSRSAPAWQRPPRERPSPVRAPDAGGGAAGLDPTDNDAKALEDRKEAAAKDKLKLLLLRKQTMDGDIPR